MKKPSIFSSFSSVVGIILGILGVSFILYSLYILFFIPLKQDLINILPSKDFQFILIAGENNNNIPDDITNQLPFPIPHKGAIVLYKENLDFISITPELNTTKTLGNKICKNSHQYDFCTSSKNSVALYQIIEAIENENPSLLTLDIFEDNSSFFSDENTYSFAGTTSFLEKNIEQLPLATSKEKKFIKQSLSLSADSLPYFSGRISVKNKKYEIQFQKKNISHSNSDEDTLSIFPSSINNKIISSSYIYPNISSYIYVRKPKFFLNYIQKNSDEKSLPKTISLYHNGKEWVSSFFSHKAIWDEDIEPLLATDILFMNSNEGSGIISLLPNETIGNKFYERFYDILLEISSEIVPEKQGVALKDGTMIYEIFPSEKNVKIVKNETNKADDMKFAFFITKDPSAKKEKIFAIAQKNETLIIADSKKFIENIKRKKSEKKNFSIPLEKEIFFALGITNEIPEKKKNLKNKKDIRTDENKEMNKDLEIEKIAENIVGIDKKSPIKKMEIIGKETEKNLIFSGTIEWNNDFFITNITKRIEQEKENNKEIEKIEKIEEKK